MHCIQLSCFFNLPEHFSALFLCLFPDLDSSDKYRLVIFRMCLNLNLSGVPSWFDLGYVFFNVYLFLKVGGGPREAGWRWGENPKQAASYQTKRS